MEMREIIVLVTCVIALVLIIIFIYLFLKLLTSSKGVSKREVTKIERQIIEEEVIKSSSNVSKTYKDELTSDLKEKDYSEEEIKKITSLTIKELLLIKNTNVHYPSNFIIDLITQKISEHFVFEIRKDIAGFNVVLNKTVDHNSKHIESYLNNLQDVETSSQTGKKLSAFKINGKSFALVSVSEDNKYRVTLKCGTTYAKKIMELYPGKIAKAQFPHGLIWFTVTDEVSLELTKSLIEISYTIAKAGY